MLTGAILSFRECRLKAVENPAYGQTPPPPAAAGTKPALFSRARSARTAQFAYIFYVYDSPYSSVTAEAFCTRVPVLRPCYRSRREAICCLDRRNTSGKVFPTRLKSKPGLAALNIALLRRMSSSWSWVIWKSFRNTELSSKCNLHC